jgi:predicted outer membrane repeat protein
MPTAPSTTSGASFVRRRAVRVASGIASVGVFAGFSLIGATSASAATDADCTPSNTVTANALGTNASDIQTLLNGLTPPAVICISGTFNVTTTLTYGYNVTLHGVSSTHNVLDAGGTTRILSDSTSDTLIVENLTFANGAAGRGLGGAISGFAVEAYNSDFTTNKSQVGGAIYAQQVQVFDSTFEENQGGDAGGAIAAGAVRATRSTFHHNGAAGLGGAIVDYGPVDVDSSTFDANQASSGGAISAYGAMSVKNSTFVGNTSNADGGRGGAIFTHKGGNVLQSTFWDNNSADIGGRAIFALGGELDVRGNIFSDDASAASQLAATNTTILHDQGGNLFTTTAAAETALASPDPSSKFSLTVSSLFGPAPALADNGGPTKTVALSSTSVAIDAVPVGSPSVTVDQRGVARTGLSDAGAYEAPAPALASTGAAPSTWIGGVAALLLVGGAAVLGLSRRRVRSR